MGKIEPQDGKYGNVGGGGSPTLRLVCSSSRQADASDLRERAVRGARRRLGRLLRALPAADWNASAFPDAVITRLAQCDSVSAAYLWGLDLVEDDAVDAAVEALGQIERWVRSGLSSQALAAVRRRELQVRILDEQLRDPLVLSEWTCCFVDEEGHPQEPGLQEDLVQALRQLSFERLGVIARRLGVASRVDGQMPADLVRLAVEQSVLRTLADPASLSVLISTLPDSARRLLCDLCGGCTNPALCDIEVVECSGAPLIPGSQPPPQGHPVQVLRDCALVFVDPSCRLTMPQSLMEPVRVVLAALSQFEPSLAEHRAGGTS